MSEQKLIKSKILQRIDNEQNWTSVNPILSSAEIVFSRTQNGTFMKLGDGRHYNDTPFYQDIKIDENQISSLNFVHISKEDYEQLVVTSAINESTIYFLSGEIDAYGRRIMNVKNATEISDAVNLGQMLEYVQQVSGDFQNYYEKSETSSSQQIKDELDKLSSKAETSSLTSYLNLNSQNQQTVSVNQNIVFQTSTTKTTFLSVGYLQYEGQDNGAYYLSNTWADFEAGSHIQMENGSNIELKSGSNIDVDTSASIKLRSGASMQLLNSHSKILVGSWEQISVRNSVNNLCLELDSKADIEDLSSISSIISSELSSKLYRTGYYCPEWISGEVYKGTAEEPCLYRVSYGGKIWRVNLDHNLTSVNPPPDNGTWTDVTNQYFRLYPGCRAEGFGSLAGGQYSHAEGYRTYAVTEGNGSTAAHAEGSKARAVGDASHAEGRLTLADMHAAHAEGLSAHANSQYSHAEGENTKTWARAGHAEGFETVAGLQTDSTGDTPNYSAYAHAEGEYTTAIGRASHAEGISSIASGNNSHAEGLSSIASGAGSHAEGGLRIASGKVLQTTASGEGAHAEGSGCLASGDYSHAEGVGVSATNNFAHAEGYYTKATGKYSHAEGSESQARADGAHAEGRYAIAKNTGSHVEGRFAKSSHDNVFVWSGVHLTSSTQQKNENYYYSSNLSGSFNVNPVGGIDGFFVGTSSLADIMESQVSSKADLSELDNYVLSDDFDSVISTKADISSVPKISVDGEIGDFGLMHVSRQEYEQILQDGPLSNVLYLVSSEYNNAYGMQIKNLSAGTDLSDAVNLEQLNQLSSQLNQVSSSIFQYFNGVVGNLESLINSL